MSALARAAYRICGAVALAVSFGLGASPASAEPVDVQLVLAVDVSLSMSPEELEIQRHGYAAALTHDSVLQAIADGAHGKIAVTYVEWAGTTWQRVVVPWTVIATRADSEKVAAQLFAHTPNGARRTSISAGLQFGADLFAESTSNGVRRVIDISGDGPNNQGAPVAETRDAVVRQGITINGLPLMTRSGFTSVYDIDRLDDYYRDCVIGGPGAFMIPVNDWTQFPEAVRRKLVLELAGPFSSEWAYEEMVHPPVLLAQGKPAADCLAGEKMWRSRSWNDSR